MNCKHCNISGITLSFPIMTLLKDKMTWMGGIRVGGREVKARGECMYTYS